MKWGRMLKMALKNIMRNRMRSFLTMLGIIIGVGSVIAMLSVGQGAQMSVENNIASLGTNLLIVMPGSFRGGGVNRGASSYNRLELSDAEAILEKAEHVAAVSAVVQTRDQIIAGRNNWNSTITGVSDQYLEIRDWELESGLFFTEKDSRYKKKVAVLGKTVADQLFPEIDPIGSRIRVRNVPFTVIGVLKEKGQGAMGNDSDDVVLAPVETVFYRLTNGRRINSLLVSAQSEQMMDAATEEIKMILRHEHRIPDDVDTDDEFTVRSQTEISDMASEVTGTFTMLLAAIAGVSLLVGGIGIMNIMLVSVTERTREIGIRMAVGARKSDIMLQFLVESMVMSMVGGLLGILTGWVIGRSIGNLMELTILYSPLVAMIAFFFSGGVGIFFGFYPARKAASLDPIDALHYE
jgi:putative ABC transport system permease protein